jgi:hypothetical protein
MAGILDYDPENARMNAFYQGLLNAGAAMAAGGGPSSTPGAGMAGALTQGLGAFGQGYRGALQENQAAAVNAYKMEQMKQAAEAQRRKQAAYDAYVNQTIPLTGEAGPTVQAAQDGQAMLPKIPGLTPEIARTMDQDTFSKYVQEMNAERAKRTMDVEYEPLKAGAIEQAKNAPLLARKAGEGEIEYKNRMRTEAGLNPILSSRAGSEAQQRQAVEAAYAAAIAERRAMGETKGLLGSVNIGGSVMPAGAARPFLAEFGKTIAGTTPVNVDGRTVSASQAEAEAKKGAAGRNVLSIIDEIEPLDETGKPIPGKSLLERSTGSGVGSMVDWGARQVGVVTPGAQAIAQLKPYEAMLVSAMPRMEGPQSDRDVQLYREAAGQVADPTIPVEMRRAALSSLRALNSKYAQAGGYRVLR